MGREGKHRLNKVSKFVVVSLMVAGALPLLAQQSRIYRDGSTWVEEITGSLPAARNLRVETQAGMVNVQGGAQGQISYTVRKRAFTSSEEAARREFEAFKINAARRGDSAVFEGEWQGRTARKFSADFSLQVPRDIDLVKIETGGGGLSVKGISGRVEAESGGGGIKLDDIAGPITAQTGGDNISVGTVGGDLTLDTGGGNISIGTVKGRVVARTGGGNVLVASGLQNVVVETGGGNIDVKKCTGEVKASTGGGSIDMGELSGPAKIETGGGSIRLAGAKGFVRVESGGGTLELHNLTGGARAETGAGAIMAEFIGGTPFEDSMLQTAAGDITVYLPSNLPVTVRAAVDIANGHKIYASDFPNLKVTSEGGEWGPQRVTAEGALNGGGHVLKIRTSSGNIYFRRASK